MCITILPTTTTYKTESAILKVAYKWCFHINDGLLVTVQCLVITSTHAITVVPGAQPPTETPPPYHAFLMPGCVHTIVAAVVPTTMLDLGLHASEVLYSAMTDADNHFKNITTNVSLHSTHIIRGLFFVQIRASIQSRSSMRSRRTADSTPITSHSTRGPVVGALFYIGSMLE